MLPEYIDQGLWDDFLDIRRQLKAKNTDRALKTLLKRLDQFKQKGHNPNEIIETSIMNSWKGVFEPKGGNHEKTKRTFNDTFREQSEIAKQWLDSIEAESGNDGEIMG